ncbi:hypothetical protein D7B62_12740 [Staphylococcus aureus]|nr:hypothetical protein D7B62_12740 [Staphylococcus aureus]
MSKRNSTDNASWRGPNTEAGGKSAYNNVQVGGAPTQKLAESQLTITCKLGWGPNIVKLDSQFLQAMEVGGAPT